MALENSEYPIAINMGSDRDLSRNWRLLQHGHRANTPGVACPSARYNPSDEYYYVFEGGDDITLTRSKDLLNWEKRNMSIMTHCSMYGMSQFYNPEIVTLNCNPKVSTSQFPVGVENAILLPNACSLPNKNVPF